jgi:hypothetical protein
MSQKQVTPNPCQDTHAKPANTNFIPQCLSPFLELMGNKPTNNVDPCKRKVDAGKKCQLSNSFCTLSSEQAVLHAPFRQCPPRSQVQLCVDGYLDWLGFQTAARCKRQQCWMQSLWPFPRLLSFLWQDLGNNQGWKNKQVNTQLNMDTDGMQATKIHRSCPAGTTSQAWVHVLQWQLPCHRKSFGSRPAYHMTGVCALQGCQSSTFANAVQEPLAGREHQNQRDGGFSLLISLENQCKSPVVRAQLLWAEREQSRCLSHATD